MVPPASVKSTLPVELDHVIIDFLHLDTRSLAQCSMVCKSWRLRSYKYKFATVPLAEGSVLFFNALIQNNFSASGIIPSVRNIHLHGPPSTLSAWADKVAAITEILLALTAPGNIAKFTLRNFAWSILPYGGPSFNLSGLRTVSTLELLQTNFSTRAELLGFLENFKGLRHLVLEDVDCASFPRSLPKTLPSGSYGLALRCPQDFSLRKRLRWDCDPSDNGTISAEEFADLTVLTSWRHNEVTNILPTLGCSLHRLQLVTQTIHTYPDVALSNLDLSRTTSLKQLSLGSSKRVLSLLPWVPLILAQLPSNNHPTLTHLQFAFASSRQFHLDRPTLLVLSDILSRPNFHRLQTIHFAVFDATGDRDLMRIVRHTICEALGSWYHKGALGFTFSRL